MPSGASDYDRHPENRRPSSFDGPNECAPPPQQARGPSTAPEPSDELGEFILDARRRLALDGFVSLVRATRERSDLSSSVRDVPHSASSLLDRMRRLGVPVPLSTPPLDVLAKDVAMAYGSHGSTAGHISFVREELADFVRKGFFLVLPYEDVRHWKNLRLSPMGCIPQRGRRPRLIIDYTWSGVNPATVRLSPDSMQFGRALPRLLQRIYEADPAHGPVHMLKVDLSDGFYRVWITESDIPKLGVALPPGPNGEQLVAFPLCLPMGWVESPPHFCAVTETVADLANDTLRLHRPVASSHPMDSLADSTPPTYPSLAGAVPMHLHGRPPRQGYLSYVDVYVDDFLGLSNGPPEERSRVRRALLEALDAVIRPLDEGDNSARKAPASIKKLAQGDGAWATQKILLGWLIDSIQGTITLPPHRQDRLLEILAAVSGKRRVSLRRWRSLVGELRSMMIALPGSEGLFSQLQAALVAQKGGRVRVNKSVQDELDDWTWLAHDICNRPTSIAECASKPPSTIGAKDASGDGMGGVVFNLRRHARPLCWRHRFPPEVTADLVSFENKGGRWTNSDLEMTALVAQQDVVAQTRDVRHTTTITLGDNTPAIFWSLRGSVSRDTAAAYLLRQLSLHRRHYRYSNVFAHFPGVINRMADDCSRLWHLTDSEFLSYMNSTYPQRHSWHLYQLRPPLVSALISSLYKRRSTPESYLAATAPIDDSGKYGVPSSPPSTWTPTCPRYGTKSQSFKFLPTEFAAVNSPSTVLRCEHVLLRRTSGPLARRTPGWDAPTRAKTTLVKQIGA